MNGQFKILSHGDDCLGSIIPFLHGQNDVPSLVESLCYFIPMFDLSARDELGEIFDELLSVFLFQVPDQEPMNRKSL